VTVAIVAEAPGPGCLPGLAPILGPESRGRLQLLLVARAVRWALAAARGGQVALALAGEPAADVAATLPAGVRVLAGSRAGEALELVDAGLAPPLLIAGAVWPRLGAEHAAAAWADLDAGADAVFGPALDGGAYLVGFAQPAPELLALPGGPTGLARAMEVARERGWELGLLRHERALTGVDDAAAFLADPRLHPDVRAALRG
jgi:glycosyltransferase A (GT-A) superfamily protein (DUF2064 family)